MHVKEIELNGCSISGPEKLSDAFNDHFADIGPSLADKIPGNESSRSYLDYLSCNENGKSFQLKTTSSIVYSLLFYPNLANLKQPVWIKFQLDCFVNILI